MILIQTKSCPLTTVCQQLIRGIKLFKFFVASADVASTKEVFVHERVSELTLGVILAGQGKEIAVSLIP